MPGLQYRETIAIDSGGYPGEGVGSNGHTNWTDAAMSGTSSVSYYYHDSDYANDNNSSKVTVVITTTWTAVQNNDNSIDVTFSSVIDSLSRGDIRGNPGTVGRTITIYNKPGGNVVWGPQSTAVQTPATYISTDVPIATQTVHIAPQSEANLASLYYLNVMRGYEGRPLPNIGTDAMRMGVFFRNTLPPDYRPGKTWDGNIWQSHNREAGSYPSRNLVNVYHDHQAGYTMTTRGVTITWLDNERIKMQGTATGQIDIAFYGGWGSYINPAGFLGANWQGQTFSGHIYGENGSLADSTLDGHVWFFKNGASYWTRWGSNWLAPTDTGVNGIEVFITVPNGRTVDDIFRVQVERGAPTEWTPHAPISYPAGAADIWTSTSSKRTMRTQDGASGSNNPPQIYHTPGVKLNMRKIGEHA